MSIRDALWAAIRSDDFDLKTVLARIEFFYAKGEISEQDREDLINFARSRAADAMGMDVKAEIKAIVKMLTQLDERLKALEEKIEPSPEPHPEPDIPDWVQPTGAHDAYNTGDKVRYKGRYYECLMDACVWAPDVLPSAWKEIWINAEVEA